MIYWTFRFPKWWPLLKVQIRLPADATTVYTTAPCMHSSEAGFVNLLMTAGAGEETIIH